MSINALKEYTLKAKYARYNPSARRRETYAEATNRVRNMMLEQYPEAADEVNAAYDMVLDKRVLGSQRALQFGGTPVLKHNARLYNCCASYCDRLRFFQEALYLLLCGCGTGFSVQKHHVNKLPAFIDWRWQKNNYFDLADGYREKKTFVIPDTIEGWADALGILITTYFNQPQEVFRDYWGCDVEFDFSQIRPEGSYLASGAGKAPGPKPLKKSLEKIRHLLDECLIRGQRRLRPIDAYDIVMHASDAVLAGGVRRSATICIFSHDDEEMLTAKTGNWFVDNPQRGRSNNSVLLLRNKTTYEEFANVMKHVRDWGEPGFFWSDSIEQMTNPCVEIGKFPKLLLPIGSKELEEVISQYHGPISIEGVDKEGRELAGLSGWQFCNLTTINGQLCKTAEDFYQACYQASVIGTLQAGFTKFEYLGRVSEMITEREALLGVSITGVMDSPKILLNPNILEHGAKIVKEANEKIANLININAAARTTCVKPEGTTSCLLGTGSGASMWKFRRGFRRVQANRNENVAKFFETYNPVAVEPSVWCANKTTNVLTFCVEAPPDAIVEGDISAVDYLGVIRLLQNHWVAAGKRSERCVKPWLNHNVSNTVVLQPYEWEDVTKTIYEFRHDYAGISLLAATGDKDYEQAPFTKVYNELEIETEYGPNSVLRAKAFLAIIYRLYNNLSEACDDILNEPSTDRVSRIAFRTIVRMAAKQYYGGDKKRLVYLLKDMANWLLWSVLVEVYQDVDYNQLIEDEDFTTPAENLACSGGACEVNFG